MLRPPALTGDDPHGPWSCRGADIWATLCAARDGDVEALGKLLDRDPNLYRAEYWYTQPIHFAVREGRLEATRRLLDAGADPAWRSLGGDDLITTARDRGHDAVERLLRTALESAAQASATTPDPRQSALHAAVDAGDAARVGQLLSEAPELLSARDAEGRSLLTRAVAASAHHVVDLLLERGADPNRPEGPAAPRGAALHLASRAADQRLVELLLDRGADPNATLDSAGSATFAAATPEIRERLVAAGGRLDPYDLIFLSEDEEALRCVEADPCSADRGCGGALAAACSLGKHELVERLLAAGARVPPTLTECRSYLWSEPATLRLLLDSGMSPDLPDWQHATPLHSLCSRDSRGRARAHRRECAELFLDAGATIDARDEDYRSTPLAWAARAGLPDMVELLLERGAPTVSADDPEWATPLAWAKRRGHDRIVALLSATEGSGC